MYFISPTRLEDNNLLEVALSSLEVFVYVDQIKIGVNRRITSLFTPNYKNLLTYPMKYDDRYAAVS